MDEKITEFYTVSGYMNKFFDQNARSLAFNAAEPKEYEKWSETVRKTIVEVSGIDKLSYCDLTPFVTESIEFDGYRRDKIVIQTEPSVYMPFYVLISDGGNKKHPVFIQPHEHGASKHSVSGASEFAPVRERMEKLGITETFAQKLCKKGYIVLCPDARGSGERREPANQSDEHFFENSHRAINNMAMGIGLSLIGMMTHDLMRLLDYIQTRDDCDLNRIGCGGFSGGGLQSVWLAALDNRISCAFTSGNFAGYKQSLMEKPGNCGCNFVPNLWRYVDIGDFGALIAPRPFLVQNGIKDPLNGRSGIDNVISQIDTAKQAYKILDATNNLNVDIHDGTHVFIADSALDFVLKNL